MKKLYRCSRRKILGIALTSLVLGISYSSAVLAEAGDQSVFEENANEVSVLEESSQMRKQLANLLRGKKVLAENADCSIVESKANQETASNSADNITVAEDDASLDTFSRSVQKPIESAQIQHSSTTKTASIDNPSDGSLGRRFLERYYASIGRSYSDTSRQMDHFFKAQENSSRIDENHSEGKSLGSKFLKRYEEATKPQEPVIIGDSALSDYPQRSLDCQYLDYESGASNIIFVKPGFKTDILLPAGDKLQRITCGDRQRFDVKTYFDKSDLRWHIYVQPYQHDITTNVIISTDRHTFQAKLETTELLKPFVRWNLPDDIYAGYLDRNVVMDVESVKDLNFAYAHNGKINSDWAPLNVFDDKHWNTYLSFERNILQRINPVILARAEDGTMVIVPYEKRGDILVMDKVYKEFDVRVGNHVTNYVRIAR